MRQSTRVDIRPLIDLSCTCLAGQSAQPDSSGITTSARAAPLRWAVVVASGGHFAAAMFDIAPRLHGKQQPKAEPPLFEVVAHKTMHRYVVRCASANMLLRGPGTRHRFCMPLTVTSCFGRSSCTDVESMRCIQTAG